MEISMKNDFLLILFYPLWILIQIQNVLFNYEEFTKKFIFSPKDIQISNFDSVILHNSYNAQMNTHTDYNVNPTIMTWEVKSLRRLKISEPTYKLYWYSKIGPL